MKRIKFIGCELEGGFLRKQYETARNLNLWHDDSSVHVSSHYSGEILTGKHASVESVCKFIREHYPIEVNNSCGFHIHLSFKSNLDYARLLGKAFHRHFLKKWKQWGKENDPGKAFWNRWGGKQLEGTNRNYCVRGYQPFDRICEGREAPDRYFQINFSWKRHGTMENRMLPMFSSAELACKAVAFYVDMVERWLWMQPKDGFRSADIEVEDDGGHTVEELVIEGHQEIKELLCV